MARLESVPAPEPTLPGPSPARSGLARWIHERRATLGGVAIGTVTWPLAIGTAWLLWPASAPPPDRVAYSLQLAAAPALLVLLMIASCLRLFDTAKAENPLLGEESARFKVNQRVLSNTIEQSWVLVPLLFALSARLAPDHLKLLPIAVSVWCVGRLLFWAGYHVAPHWRAPGFDWTLLTNALLAGWFIKTLV